jgi:two-component system sensor histidine kinase SenX3
MTVLVAAIAAVVAGVVGYYLGHRVGISKVAVVTADDRRPDETTPVVTPPQRSIDIERALADLQLGVIVVDVDGGEIYRNNQAKQYATGRHGDALVEAALERVVGGALVGLSLEEAVEVYGPPARSLLVQASPTYTEGDIDGAVGVIEDVTEARHTARVRSDFVANVSHELRTPVGAMSVLAETIAAADDPEVVDRLADRMQREANRLSNTIDDLLALSRLESGPVSDPETIDLASVANMAIERTVEAAQQRNVTVELERLVDGPVLIDGDQGQLVSAVANLVDNAIKYSDADGGVVVQIGVGLHRDDGDGPDDRPDDRVAELSVVDTGIGIPDRDLDRIFERFYRVDSARSRETGGTGLGLSIVRHALLNHRGAIEVQSTEGRGSTFTIRLPLSESHVGPTDSASTTAAGPNTGESNSGESETSGGQATTRSKKWTN